ncbi:hypothetical protein DRQ33_02070 [bacterium]|nr:MAG: hypothetical protein DRQ33_02070 [bacterium]
MLEIIVIILLIAVIFLGVMIVLMWLRFSEKSKSKPTVEEKLEKPLEIPKIGQEKTAETLPEKTQKPPSAEGPKKPETSQRRTKIPKPNISPNARIENLTEAYTNLAGVIGSVISDRFGQPISVDADFFLDKVTVPAYLVEIFAHAKEDKLSIGKTKNVLMMGEGSYWILGEIAGVYFGLWIERDVLLNDGLELYNDFKLNMANTLKHYYTKIW